MRDWSVLDGKKTNRDRGDPFCFAALAAMAFFPLPSFSLTASSA
jgi:hypothetical protein